MKVTRYINIIKVKNFFCFIFLVLLGIAVFSCASAKPEEKKTTVVEEKKETPVQQEKTRGHKVSEEVYNKTFRDVELVIAKLNEISKKQDFDEWRRYCTPQYSAYYSKPENLKQFDTVIKKAYGTNVKTLKDYFFYVFVPSRENARLDRITFIDDNNIEAEMFYETDKVWDLLYKLVNINGTWKIGL
jgi:hypothetical protein